MDTNDANDEHDELADDIDEATYRERAAAKLDQIARDAKQALVEHDIDVFFMIPNSGRSIIVFGTPADPDDETWKTVSAVVSGIVRGAIGLDRSRCRSLACATTASVADRQPTGSPVQPSESSGCCSMPMHAPAVQHTGAEVR